MRTTFYLLIILLSVGITYQATADDKPLTGQAKIDSLLAELPKAKGDTNEVILLGTISNCYYTINPIEGIKFAKKGVNLSKNIDWEKGEAKCYNMLGYNYSFGQSNYEKAIEYLLKAIEINKRIGNLRGLSSNYNLIGQSFMYQSNFPLALDYFYKSIEINQRINNKWGTASNYISIGNIYENQSKYPKALDYYNKALKEYESIDNSGGIGDALGSIGNIYFLKFNYSEAMKYFKKALKKFEMIDNIGSLAIIHSNIGSIYESQSKYEEAIRYYNKAIEYDKKLGNLYGLGFGFNNLSSIYYAISNDMTYLKSIDEGKSISLNKETNLNKSIEYNQRAEKIFKEINALDELSYVYNLLYKSYKSKGDFQVALDFHEKYKELQDSVYSQESKNKIVALQKARETDINRITIEKQNVELSAQKKERNYIIFSAIGSIFSVLLVLGVIYNQRRKSDKLLYNVLPISIAKRLKKKEHPISDYFTQASIIFIDIVGFTSMSRDADPRDIVIELNKIFTHYDTIANKYGLEKIKTIGDSYMAAAGIPLIQEDNTHRAAQMALEVKAMMTDYHTADGTQIEVRIGLDCGPVVAGVIGENKFIYDMWSDAVNTASRMESTSIAGQVHVSERFKEAVSEYEEFDYVERGEIEIKGKGKMKTYFIEDKKMEMA